MLRTSTSNDDWDQMENIPNFLVARTLVVTEVVVITQYNNDICLTTTYFSCVNYSYE